MHLISLSFSTQEDDVWLSSDFNLKSVAGLTPLVAGVNPFAAGIRPAHLAI